MSVRLARVALQVGGTLLFVGVAGGLRWLHGQILYEQAIHGDAPSTPPTMWAVWAGFVVASLIFLYVAFQGDGVECLTPAPSSSDVAAAEEGPASHVPFLESRLGSAVRGRPARVVPLEAQD